MIAGLSSPYSSTLPHVWEWRKSFRPDGPFDPGVGTLLTEGHKKGSDGSSGRHSAQFEELSEMSSRPSPVG